MSAPDATVKTMKLRYPGTCTGCGAALPAGVRAHYLVASRTVRCADCGPGTGAPTSTDTPTDEARMHQRPLPAPGGCADCGRPLVGGADARRAPDGRGDLCLDCVTLDAAHSLGVAGAGARREHDRRRRRRDAAVRANHPLLGGVLLAMTNEPQHVQAWAAGARGEEEFGRRLAGVAGERLKVLQDRKIPRSSANIDHLAVTTEAVWVLDAKRYRGRVEARGGGVFSSKPAELYVAGRSQTKLVDGVARQVKVVEDVLIPFAFDRGLGRLPPVRGALVFVGADFGWFSSPLTVGGIWVGWGKAARQVLTRQTGGDLPVAAIAKHLARELRAG